MKGFHRFASLLVIGFLTSGGQGGVGPCAVKAQGVQQSTVGMGRNFEVRSFLGGPRVGDVLETCEKLRLKLAAKWGVAMGHDAWSPKCSICLYASESQYLQAIGGAGFGTQGSSLIRIEQGKTLMRRLDLLVDRDGSIPALQHELTHVVLAERFGGRQPPLWFDEGAATLADSPQKQSLHERDLREALHGGRAIPLATLLRLEQFQSADQVKTFYGQSVSLMRFLCEQGGSERAAEFTAEAMTSGVEGSLAKHFGMRSVDELERRWKQYVYVEGAAVKNTSIKPPTSVGRP